MKLTPQIELLVGIAIIAVVAVAVVGLLIVPQFGVISDLDAQLNQSKQDVQKANLLLAQRQSAKQEAAQTQADLMTLQNQVPDTPELPTLIIELQNIATQSGLSWIKIEPKTPEDRSGYSAVPVTVDLQGTWADTVDYVRRLERTERQVRVKGVDITSLVDANQQSGTEGSSSTSTSSTANGPVQLKTTIQLEAYVMGSTGTGSSSVPAAPSSSGSAPSGAKQ